MISAKIINSIATNSAGTPINCLEFRVKRLAKTQVSKKIVILAHSPILSQRKSADAIVNFTESFSKNPKIHVENVMFFDTKITSHIYCNAESLTEYVHSVTSDDRTDICAVFSTLTTYIASCSSNMAIVVILGSCIYVNDPQEIIESLITLHNVARKKMVEFHCISLGLSNDIFLLDKMTKIATAGYTIQHITFDIQLSTALDRMRDALIKYSSRATLTDSAQTYSVTTINLPEYIIGRLYGVNVSEKNNYILGLHSTSGAINYNLENPAVAGFDDLNPMERHAILSDYCYVNLQFARSLISNSREVRELNDLLKICEAAREYHNVADKILRGLPQIIQKNCKYDHQFLSYLIDYQKNTIEEAINRRLSAEHYGHMLQLLSGYRHRELRGLPRSAQMYREECEQFDRGLIAKISGDIKQHEWQKWEDIDFAGLRETADCVSLYFSGSAKPHYISTEYFLNNYRNNAVGDWCQDVGGIIPLLHDFADKSHIIQKIKEVFGFPSHADMMIRLSAQPFDYLAAAVEQLFSDDSAENRAENAKKYNFLLETCKEIYKLLVENENMGKEFAEKMRFYARRYSHPGFTDRPTVENNKIFCAKLLCGILTDNIPQFEDEQDVTGLFLAMLCEEHRRNIPQEYIARNFSEYFWENINVNQKYFCGHLREYEDNLKKLSEESQTDMFKRRFCAVSENAQQTTSPRSSGMSPDTKTTSIPEIEQLIADNFQDLIADFKFSSDRDGGLFIDKRNKCNYIKCFFKLFTQKDLVQSQDNSIVWLCMCLQNLIQHSRDLRISAVKNNPFDVSIDIITDHYVMKWSDDVREQYIDFTGPGAYDRAIVWLRGLVREAIYNHINAEKARLYKQYITDREKSADYVRIFIDTDDLETAAGILVGANFGREVSKILAKCGCRASESEESPRPIPLIAEKLLMIMSGEYRGVRVIKDFSAFTRTTGGRWTPGKRIKNRLIRRNGPIISEIIDKFTLDTQS